MNKVIDLKNQILRNIFSLQKPKIAFVIGRNSFLISKIIAEVLKVYSKNIFIFQGAKIPLVKTSNEFFVLASDTVDFDAQENMLFLIKNSRKPIFLIKNAFENAFDKRNLFLNDLVKNLPVTATLVLNLDDENINKAIEKTNITRLTFGLGEKADVSIGDVKNNGELNFKINYRGNMVPVWMTKFLSENNIDVVLAAVSVCLVFGLNLVEISQALKNIKIN